MPVDDAPQSPFERTLEEATIVELQAEMAAGHLTARALVDRYLQRIDALDRSGPTLRAVIEVNPDAQAIADALDRERDTVGPRGPLHGIPILVKDNMDTADKMMTTAGSLALMGARPPRDAFVVQRLREAGAVILGKTNLSEWSNFRSTHSSSGWSARGGQCRNPYALDRSPIGSSAGSGVAAAANLAAATVGTETDGSIVSPAAANGVVGIKPTVGLTSRAGVIPISHSQDTVGPLARTVADAAAVLSAVVGVDPRDAATAASTGKIHMDYTQFLDPEGLRGARLGVAREVYFGYSDKADAVVEAAIATMRDQGAVIVDPANIPTARDLTFLGSELPVLLYEFKANLNRYLAGLGPDAPVHTLMDIIHFNERHAAEELRYFDQNLFHMAEEKGALTDPAYSAARDRTRLLARAQGIDAVMDAWHLDALVMPTTCPPWKIDLVNGDHIMGGGASPAAQAGYPSITVPAGLSFGLPVGVLFTGRAFSEPTLIKVAYAFEQATRARRPPTFVATSV